MIVTGKFILTAVGGHMLNAALDKLLSAKKFELRPTWSYERRIVGMDGVNEDSFIRRSDLKPFSFPHTTPSFTAFSKRFLLEEVKASPCVVHENPTIELSCLRIVAGS